ncbi:MAG: hypothetical protein ACR2L8_03130 [Solirubrobacteraceae bacterium]
MPDLESRRGGRPTRKARADRAYTLVLATSGLLVLTIVLFVLAVLGIVGSGAVVVAGILTAGSGLLLRRTMR